MKRLLSTLWWDARRQFRYGFYYASAFTAVVLILALGQIPVPDFRPWWPPVILENLVMNSFYFMSGLVLFEKGEGVLEAQIVTPLRRGEYLFSKVLTLGLLATIETLILVVALTGVRFNWLLLIAGILILIGVLALYGFIAVARYDSISDFMLPSVIWTLGVSLPLLYYFNLWPSPLLFLHPLQAPMLLIQSAFQPIPSWQVVYGLLYGGLWLVVTFLISRRAFYRFVIKKEGVS